MLKKKQADQRDDVAIIRLEQLYPFPEKHLDLLLDRYKSVKSFWVQEEPRNMGAWNYIRDMLPFDNLDVVARKASASPATGFKKVHDEQQAALVAEAFA